MFRKNRDALRLSLELLARVKAFRHRVDLLYNRLLDRRQTLMDKLTQLEAKGEKYLSKIYANEIANLDKLISHMSLLIFVLEKVETSIQYAITLRDFRSLAGELSKVMGDIAKMPEIKAVPDLNLYLIDIESLLREMSSAEVPSFMSTPVETSGSDAKKILEEAREILRKKIETELST